MGYDVTNNSSIVELGPGRSVPTGSDLTPIELPDVVPSPQLVGSNAIAPVGKVVELPTNLPTQELITVSNVTPAGYVVELPSYLPPEGVILLETIPIPNFLSGGGGVISTPVEESVFASDITVVLSGGKTFGKYSNGDVIPALGKTAAEVILDVAIEYVNAAFTSFSVSGQSTTIEIGTTLSGLRTFIWGIAINSGSVPTLTIYDGTTSTNILVDTSNDGSEMTTINTIQLNSDGATQQWRGIGTDVTPTPDVVFYSSYFIVTSRFYRFYGPILVSPTDSASVRALPSSDFQVGANTFNLNTGLTLTKFVVALPPGRSIASVIDLDALSADITSEYIAQPSINVLDAGGTNRAYNIYEMNVGVPYSSDHRHQITTT